jgi:CRISPR-associated protein Cas1
MLGSIVVFGSIHQSPSLIQACAMAGISIVLLDRVGRFSARVEGPVSGNVLLRRAQYRISEQPLEIVRSIVVGKIANQRSVLMRALRDYGCEYATSERLAIEAAVDRLAHVARKAELSDASSDALRGSEGEAANRYFGVFDLLIRSTEPELRFTGRSRRPPLDAINSLLSFLYTLLVHDCRAATESVGLDPAVGFLHRDRPGRPSLALDLMEELRPVLADRVALSLVNRRQLKGADFQKCENGAVVMLETARKQVLAAWQDRKKQERMHPYLGEKMPLGLVPFVQAQMLARHLRGDIDAYPPWFGG